MSHKHRDKNKSEPAYVKFKSGETVTIPDSVQDMNLKTDFDTSYIDPKLAMIVTEPEIGQYIGETMSLAESCVTIQSLLAKMEKSDYANELTHIKPEHLSSYKLLFMFAIGLIAGASCAVKAVDDGLIVDGEGDYDDGQD
jgi:hypothetical protein